jgi:glycosyltransferase involved in cell wall biosynthesis
MKKLELDSLRIADTVVVNNPKDLNMIKKDGITVPIMILAPYYQSMLASSRTFKMGDNRDIIFYGAMDRVENWKSAIWFIEKVLPLLSDLNVNFKVIGGNPNAKLRSYESENIHILGFVDDLKKEFASSMCMVAPLVLGAGIKVKVLEGLSAGIPVLTNQIGIEGIPAIDGKDFFLCEAPRDYAASIKKIIDGKVDIEQMEKAEKKLIKETYNLNNDEKKFHEFLVEINNIQGNENI